MSEDLVEVYDDSPTKIEDPEPAEAASEPLENTQ